MFTDWMYESGDGFLSTLAKTPETRRRQKLQIYNEIRDSPASGNVRRAFRGVPKKGKDAFHLTKTKKLSVGGSITTLALV